MTRRLRLIAICLCLLGGSWSIAPAQAPETWERYLDRYRGPYRGQVIDADTKAPLVGAVVVAMWTRDRMYPLHSVNERYAVREVVTDADGQFVLNARDVEESAPKRTHHPEFRIFLPGYGAFPRHQRSPRGFTGGIFWGAGATVELPSLSNRQQRIQSLSTVVPHNFSENPFSEVPLLVHAFNAERISLGFEPLTPVQR